MHTYTYNYIFPIFRHDREEIKLVTAPKLADSSYTSMFSL